MPLPAHRGTQLSPIAARRSKERVALMSIGHTLQSAITSRGLAIGLDAASAQKADIKAICKRLVEAGNYTATEKCREAVEDYKRALGIHERISGVRHPRSSVSPNCTNRKASTAKRGPLAARTGNPRMAPRRQPPYLAANRRVQIVNNEVK